MLDAAVHENDFLVPATVPDYFLAAYDIYLIVKVRVMHPGRIHCVLSFRNNDSEHGTILPEDLGKLSCVDSVDSRDFLLLEPLVKALDCVPVTVLERVLRNYQAPYPDFLRLEIGRNAVTVCTLVRHTVVADNRIGHTENLT